APCPSQPSLLSIVITTSQSSERRSRAEGKASAGQRLSRFRSVFNQQKAVAYAGFGADKEGVGRIVLELGPKLVDVSPEDVMVVGILPAPDLPQDHRMGKDLTA